MSRWFAIPLREDGTEKLGTDGVLVGEYGSKETFIQHKLSRYAEPGKTYNLYVKDSDWLLKGSYTQPKASEITLTDKSDTADKDSFFRYADTDWYTQSDGETCAPACWFGLLHITASLLDECDSAGREVPAIEEGAYLVVINEQGLVWAYQASTPADTAKAYDQQAAAYAKWCQLEEEDD